MEEVYGKTLEGQKNVARVVHCFKDSEPLRVKSIVERTRLNVQTVIKIIKSYPNTFLLVPNPAGKRRSLIKLQVVEYPLPFPILPEENIPPLPADRPVIPRKKLGISPDRQPTTMNETKALAEREATSSLVSLLGGSAPPRVSEEGVVHRMREEPVKRISSTPPPRPMIPVVAYQSERLVAPAAPAAPAFKVPTREPRLNSFPTPPGAEELEIYMGTEGSAILKRGAFSFHLTAMELRKLKWHTIGWGNQLTPRKEETE